MTDSNTPIEATSATRGVSRRTVTKAMAWSVPAIAVATSVPAFAASGDGPSGVFLAACKQPGGSCDTPGKDYDFVKGYTFTLTFTNNSNKTVYIYATQNGVATPDGGSMSSVLDLLTSPLKNFTNNNEVRRFTGGAIGETLPAGAAIAPNGGTLEVILNAGINGNSAIIEGHGGLYVAWGHSETPGGDQDHPYDPTPSFGLPPASQPGPHGPGWFYVPINFLTTPPCGTDCAPGGDESETDPA